MNFSTQKTMRLAQQLYEGVDVKGSGTVGLITYLRTDSTRISEEAQSAAAEYISATFGEEYKAVSEAKRQTAIRSRMRMRRSVPPISQEHRRRSKIP